MQTRVDRPAAIGLEGLTPLRREPVRPLERRGPGFAAQYDDATLFFDAFLSAEGRRAVLIGPPFLNLLPAFARMEVVARPSGERCPARLRHLDRLAQVWIDVPEGTRALTLSTGLGRIEVPLAPSGAALFRGRRTIITLSKNNPIPWILDWARYNRDRHGADAVLIYDNASSLYEPEALVEALAGLDGIGAARVVAWPFKYGPQGTLTGDWDSDYCQHGALEHARWRHLPEARSALNSDIDELVVGDAGAGIFQAVERTWSGVLAFYGRWIVGPAGAAPSPGAVARHRDFDLALRPAPRRRYGLIPVDANRCPPKWAVVPRRCPTRAQWRAHSIAGWPSARYRTDAFRFGHFRPISTGWKYDRLDAGGFDPARHERDAALARAFEAVNWAA